MENSKAIIQHIDGLFKRHLEASGPLQMLLMIKEKITARGLQSFDREDILNELGQLEKKAFNMESEMNKLYNHIKGL